MRDVPRRRADPLLIIAIAADVIGVLTAIAAIINLDGPVWATVLAIWLAVMSAVALAMLFIHIRRSDRQGRYASASPLGHQALDALRNAHCALDEGLDLPYIDRLIRDSLDAFAAQMSTITGTACRVCFKELVFEPATKHLIRSASSGEDRAASETRVYKSDKSFGDALQEAYVVDAFRSNGVPLKRGQTFVTQNTDFHSLLAEKKSPQVFFSNNLAKEGNYQNSNFPNKGTAHLREYNAAIVWPVQRTHETKRDGKNGYEDDRTVLGFLCVDTLETGKFLPAFDIHVGAGYADTLFPLMSRYGDFKRNILEKRQKVNTVGDHADEQPIVDVVKAENAPKSKQRASTRRGQK